MNDPKTLLIREIEANIIDSYYQNFEILSWDDNYIVPHLMKIWGDVVREFKSPEMNNRSSFVARREINLYIQGLGWCIKWVLKNKNVRKKAKLSYSTLGKKVHAALRWGIEYNILAQNHIGWSRGLLDVDINIKEKEIIFLPPDLKVFQFILAQELSSEDVFEKLYRSIPIIELSNYYEERKREIDWTKPPLQFNWQKAQNDSIFSVVLKWAEQTILPELDNIQDLGGYSLGELRKLFTGIFIHSTLLIFAEDEIDSQTNFANEFGSNPICFSKRETGLLLNQWSGVSKNSIEAIIDDFTFELDNFHSSLTNQPFVKLKNGSFVFLPRLFIHTELNRMISGALNKSSKKKIYDKLINVIEQKNLDKLQSFFSENNLISIKEVSLKWKNQIITPDFILIDEPNKSLFIIDYKHYLIPLNANETIFKLSEVKKAIKRISYYKSFIIENPAALAICCPNVNREYSITPILLCKWPMPVPISINEDVYVLTTDQLESLILDRGGRLQEKIERFYSKLIEEMTKKGINLKVIKNSIRVSDWYYSRSIYAS